MDLSIGSIITEPAVLPDPIVPTSGDLEHTNRFSLLFYACNYGENGRIEFLTVERKKIIT